MSTRSLGAGGPRVSMLGLGCMGMSDFYGPAAAGAAAGDRYDERQMAILDIERRERFLPARCAGAKRRRVAPGEPAP